jgi:hypothetical protein
MPGPRKSSVPCRVQWVVTNLVVFNQPLVAHDMGSKDACEPVVGGTAFQSNLVVIPTPCVVHRSSHLLYKKLAMIKGNTIAHDIVCRPSQFMGQGIVGNHEISFSRLSIIVRSRIRVVAPGTLSGLRIRPG